MYFLYFAMHISIFTLPNIRKNKTRNNNNNNNNNNNGIFKALLPTNALFIKT
jgi:hypothetical protein